MELRVRKYDPSGDARRVEELERLCDAGPSGSMSLFADSMGDPLGRVRHFALYTMLVAEIGEEIVGVIRAGIKEMVCGRKRLSDGSGKESAVRARCAYILGLRVSPLHRRKGIGLALARRIEQWCRDKGAAYAYMMTEKSNVASSGLFVGKLQFRPVRSPSILVHPVFQHWESIPSHIRLTRLAPADAAEIYRCYSGATDFFPAADIDSIVGNARCCAGTWLATLKAESTPSSGMAAPLDRRHPRRQVSVKKLLEGVFSSWAVVSVWKTNEIFTLEVSGAPWRIRAAAAASRALDRALPWLRISSFPDVFQPFGIHFLFGIAGGGARSGELVAALCKNARNVARRNGCAVVAAEMGAADPLLGSVPHWKSLSTMDDLWCVKDLVGIKNTGATVTATPDSGENWMDLPMGSSVFVDPRDF
ncbi:hypothetical protein SELMODRAFT_104443 [Selaginella moellendorffii]|uniref:Uncharacterized protein HLS1-2 n=1 Tax=Selaginella moellendorffii TaxID=88036 RepID=D8RXU8_SELML|nr:probable N-acetyltransferase HLS1 [Selaginella moellendorffii]EFJ22800.1 hypothetical protein SELMODRAFT_104443 [Selaginella moellendorffii]|eukprot:XP_002975895.1 probable N-acetyltransferase HLS1 [Selaginella moellendorffii]